MKLSRSILLETGLKRCLLLILLVQQALPDHRELRVLRGQMALRVQQGPRLLLVRQAQQVPLGLLVQALVIQDRLEQLELMVQPELLVQQVLQDPQGPKGPRDQQGLKGPQAQPELRVQLDLKELLGLGSPTLMTL